MAKLSTDKRNDLPDSEFGIPEKRMYPLNDKAHVESAVKLFGHASDADKPQLARRILAKAKEFGMDSSGWDKVNAWAKKPIPKKKDSDKSSDKSETKHVSESYFTDMMYSDTVTESFDDIMDEIDFVTEQLYDSYCEFIDVAFPNVPTSEQTAIICVGNDLLVSEADYDSFFKEAGIYDDETDSMVTIEFDEPDIVEELARGPYDEYLSRHGYDPKTNTILSPSGRSRRVRSDKDDPDSDLVPMLDDNGEEIPARISAGAIGSKKQRNRMNAFLKRSNYDPETGTIETGLLNPDGTKQRVPFGIHTDPSGDEMQAPIAYTLQDKSHGIAMDKGVLQRKPAVSTGVLQHEIGHIASQLDQNPYRARDRREAVRDISQADPHIYGNSHGVSPDEYVADRYALRHNPYDKTGTTMTHALRGYLPSQQAQRDAIQKEIETTEDSLGDADWDPALEKAFADAQRNAMNAARRPDKSLQQAQAMRDIYSSQLDGADPDTNRQIQYQIDQMDDLTQIGRNLSKKGAQRRAARKIANQNVDALRAKDADKLAELKRKGQLAEVDLRDTNSRREAVAQRYLDLKASVDAARQSADKLADMIDSGKLTPEQRRKAYRKYQRTLEYIDRTMDLMHAQHQSPEVLRDPKRIQPSKQERSAKKELGKQLGTIGVTHSGDDADPVVQAAIAGFAKQLGMKPDEFVAKAQAGELPEDVGDKVEELFDRYDKTGDTSIFGKELEPVMAAGKKVDDEQRKRRAAETARIHEARDKARAKNPDRKRSINIIGAPQESEKKQPIESASLTMTRDSDKSKTGKRVISEKEITPVPPEKDSMTVNDQKEPKTPEEPKPAMENAYIQIGDDVILQEQEDFDTFMDEVGYVEEDFVDRTIHIVDEYATELLPYDQLLMEHSYDADVNTIEIDGKTMDAGTLGTQYVRDRMNKFIQEFGSDQLFFADGRSDEECLTDLHDAYVRESKLIDCQFSEFIQEGEVWEKIKGGIKQVWEWIKQFFSWLGRMIMKFIRFIGGLFKKKKTKSADQCVEEAIGKSVIQETDTNDNMNGSADTPKTRVKTMHIDGDKRSDIKSLDITLISKSARYIVSAKQIKVIEKPYSDISGATAFLAAHLITGGKIAGYTLDDITTLVSEMKLEVDEHKRISDDTCEKFCKMASKINTRNNAHRRSLRTPSTSISITMDDLDRMRGKINDTMEAISHIYGKSTYVSENDPRYIEAKFPEKMENGLRNLRSFLKYYVVDSFKHLSDDLEHLTVVDSDYAGIIKNGSDLSKVIENMVESRMPVDDIRKNIFILCDRSMWGGGKPGLGMQRLVLIPTDGDFVYKLAYNKRLGIKGNNAETVQSNLIRHKYPDIEDIIAPIYENWNDYVITQMRCKTYDSRNVASDIFTIWQKLAIFYNSKEGSDYPYDLFNDLHAGNIGFDTRTGVARIIDYGFLVPYSKSIHRDDTWRYFGPESGIDEKMNPEHLAQRDRFLAQLDPSERARYLKK